MCVRNVSRNPSTGGTSPIYEPGVEDLLEEGLASGRLTFATPEEGWQDLLGDVVYVDLPDVGTKFSRMDVFGNGGGERLAEESGVPYIGAIPMDPAVRQGGDQGVPVTISDPDSPVAQALKSIAKDVAAKASVAAMQNNEFVPITMVG